jgi:DNA-binding MarR family transcriptional regulator
MMTSQVLRTLEQRELLQRAEHPDDKRARSLTPTAAGVTLANKANAAVEACDRAFFASLGPNVARFTRDLGRLRSQA